MSTGEQRPIEYNPGIVSTTTVAEAPQFIGKAIIAASELPEAPDILDVKPIDLTNPEDAAFLREAYEVFLRHEMLGRVGLWLVHRHKQIQVGPGKSMVEYTDPINQQQIVRPTSDSDIKPEEVVPTLLQFAFGEDGVTPVLGCASVCRKFEDGTHIEIAHLAR